jgi:hypothetical protein
MELKTRQIFARLCLGQIVSRGHKFERTLAARRTILLETFILRQFDILGIIRRRSAPYPVCTPTWDYSQHLGRQN